VPAPLLGDLSHQAELAKANMEALCQLLHKRRSVDTTAATSDRAASGHAARAAADIYNVPPGSPLTTCSDRPLYGGQPSSPLGAGSERPAGSAASAGGAAGAAGQAAAGGGGCEAVDGSSSGRATPCSSTGTEDEALVQDAAQLQLAMRRLICDDSLKPVVRFNDVACCDGRSCLEYCLPSPLGAQGVCQRMRVMLQVDSAATECVSGGCSSPSHSACARPSSCPPAAAPSDGCGALLPRASLCLPSAASGGVQQLYAPQHQQQQLPVVQRQLSWDPMQHTMCAPGALDGSCAAQHTPPYLLAAADALAADMCSKGVDDILDDVPFFCL
jgi:hypothetical protein